MIVKLFLSIVIVNCIINFVSKVKGMTISSKLLLESEVYGVWSKFLGGKGWWMGCRGSSERCLKWGGGGHSGIFPKTS